MAITFDDLPKSNGVEDVDGRAADDRLDAPRAEGAQGPGHRVRQRGEALHRRARRCRSAWRCSSRGSTPAFRSRTTPSATSTSTTSRSRSTRTMWCEASGPTRGCSAAPASRSDGSGIRSRTPGPRRRTRAGSSASSPAAAIAIAPFTIENSDWMFSSAYAKAKKAGDEALATRVRDAYLAYSDTMLDWFETLAKEDFARDIPQILVIHAERSAHRRARRAAHPHRAARLPLRHARRGDEGRGLLDAGRVHRHLRPVLAPSLADGEEAAAAHERRTGPAPVGHRSFEVTRSRRSHAEVAEVQGRGVIVKNRNRLCASAPRRALRERRASRWRSRRCARRAAGDVRPGDPRRAGHRSGNESRCGAGRRHHRRAHRRDVGRAAHGHGRDRRARPGRVAGVHRPAHARERRRDLSPRGAGRRDVGVRPRDRRAGRRRVPRRAARQGADQLRDVRQPSLGARPRLRRRRARGRDRAGQPAGHRDGGRGRASGRRC